jgi:hypothetical protein
MLLGNPQQWKQKANGRLHQCLRRRLPKERKYRILKFKHKNREMNEENDRILPEGIFQSPSYMQ